MKIFLDTAHVHDVQRLVAQGIIDGITTNPSLLAAAALPPREVIDQLCTLVSGPVSVEVSELEPAAMLEQARKIAAYAPNIVVKIPFGMHYLPVIKKLTDESIRVNVTLVFSVTQALLAAKVAATFISPFLGRLDDAGGSGLELLEKIMQAKYAYNFESEIIASSIRNLEHFNGALACGADCITLSPKLLEAFAEHELTAAGIKKFSADWAQVKDEFF